MLEKTAIVFSCIDTDESLIFHHIARSILMPIWCREKLNKFSGSQNKSMPTKYIIMEGRLLLVKNRKKIKENVKINVIRMYYIHLYTLPMNKFNKKHVKCHI